MSEGLRERKKARTHQGIVEAAVEVFRERGYEKTTVEEIVRRVEISQPTFYKYFTSKDAVLREVALRIDSQVRASDVAARYGGEEFVVLLPSTDVTSGALLAERIRSAVSASPIKLPCGDSVTMTASIGISSTQPDPDVTDLKTAGDALIAKADVALYRAKSEGRDRIAIGEQ